jgi:hypothetical protein
VSETLCEITDSQLHDATLRLLQNEYERGNKFALMVAIDECAWANSPMPNWAAIAYREAFAEVHSARVRSWDIVFGKPFKPKEADLVKKKQRLMMTIGNDIVDYRNRGGSLTSEGYETIAERHHVNRDFVQDCWKEFQFFHPLTCPLLPYQLFFQESGYKVN